MNEELLKEVLDCLEPETLAYVVRDLENSRADGQNCLGRPLTEPLRQELGPVIERIVSLGAELTGSQDEFMALVEEARDEQEALEWALQRDEQERQNWTDDLA